MKMKAALRFCKKSRENFSVQNPNLLEAIRIFLAWVFNSNVKYVNLVRFNKNKTMFFYLIVYLGAG